MIPTPLTLVTLVLAALAGLAGGLIYFQALRRSIDSLANKSGWRTATALALMRFAGAALVAAVLARLGGAALLAGFLGFLAARQIAVHSVRRSR